MLKIKIASVFFIISFFNLNAEVLNLKGSKAAKVGDVLISVSQVKKHAAISQISYQDALDELIEFELFYLISKNFIDPPDEKRLNEAVIDDKRYYASHFRKNFDDITDREFLNAAGIGNGTLEEYLKYTQKKLMVSDYLYKITSEISAQSIPVSEQEIQKYISENKTKFVIDEKLEIMLIHLSFFDKNGIQLEDDRIKDKARKAAEALQELEKGVSFSDCARKYSEDIFSLKSNPPGYFGVIEKNDSFIRKRFTDDILKALSESQPGVIKKIFGTNDGFYIFKLLEKIPGGMMDSKEAYSAALNILTDIKLEERKNAVKLAKLEEFSKHFDIVRY